MSERKHLCVYSHSANGQIFYVGQRQPARLYSRERNPRRHEHVKRVGEYEIDIHAWTDDRAEAQRIEAEMIAAHDPLCNFRKSDSSKRTCTASDFLGLRLDAEVKAELEKMAAIEESEA